MSNGVAHGGATSLAYQRRCSEGSQTIAHEKVTIENESGNVASGEAVDAAHYSDFARITIGVMWIVGGLLAALMFIVVPIVHLFSTWAFPLIGFLLGKRAFSRRVVLYQITAECPSCHETIETNGGSIDDPSWQVCPRCSAALKFRSAAS